MVGLMWSKFVVKNETRVVAWIYLFTYYLQATPRRKHLVYTKADERMDSVIVSSIYLECNLMFIFESLFLIYKFVVYK